MTQYPGRLDKKHKIFNILKKYLNSYLSMKTVSLNH